jgi:hypothetical protein
MGVTWITLAKIAGPLVGEVERLMGRWAEHDAGDSTIAGKAMVPEDDNPRIADPAVVTRMVALIADLERHASAPPVVYFARYVDPWTTAASLYFTPLLGADVGLVLSDEVDVAFFRPLGRNEPGRSLAKRLRGKDWKLRFQNFEEYQFASQLHLCMKSWEDLLDAQGVETGIVLAYQSVGGCWLDDEVEEGVRTLPAWFRH